MEKNGKYELLYIVHPDLEASIDKITGGVKSAVETRGGKISYEENWGKRKLAYPIKKSDVGIYILAYFEMPKESLGKVERDLRLTEEIMRYMLLATEDRVKTEKKPESKPKKEVEEKPKAKKEEKKEEEKPENEEERMKQIDEKLDAILGEEGDNKEDKGKEK